MEPLGTSSGDTAPAPPLKLTATATMVAAPGSSSWGWTRRCMSGSSKGDL